MKTQINGNHIIFNHTPRRVGADVLERICALEIGQKMQDLPEELWHKSFKFYVKEDPTRCGGPNLRLIRLDPAKPSLTVTGYIFNKFVHPFEDRFITPREAARLQCFPDYFEFKGSLTSVQMQVGNAVPVNLAHVVAEAILKHAEEFQPPGFAKGLYENKHFPAVSLFSGAGGLDLGVKIANSNGSLWKVQACVEYDDDCCETLKANFPRDVEIIHKNIRDVTARRMISACDLQKGVLPLLFGGPPCQAFSQAGLQKGFQDPRGQMVHEFLRFVEETEPTYFIMENVSGLKGAANGGLLRDILARMEKLGYNVNHGILSAADFGAAQLRRRIFFIGVRKPFPKVPMPEPTHGQTDGFLQVKPRVGVGEAFAGLPKICESRNISYPPATVFTNGEGSGELQDAVFVIPTHAARRISYKNEKKKTSRVKKRGFR